VPLAASTARLLLALAACSLLLAGCGSSSGSGTFPVIRSFTASPALVAGDGGVVSLSWSISGATSATIDPGVGTLPTPASGTVSTYVSGTGITQFTLTATNGAGTTHSGAEVEVCGPANLSGSCTFSDNDLCQDWVDLASTDLKAVSTGGTWCVPGGGIWASTPCPTANLVGTCQTPNTLNSAFTGIRCSISGVHFDRYYSPKWTTASVQSTGCIFIPP
jgi:hypothetical protein